jgi:hypothetical protein
MTDDLILTPNVEALIVQFLREQPEVADLVGNRVYTELPEKTTFPAVRVHLYYERPVGGSSPRWLSAHDVQVDAFGGPKATAWRIAETCRAALSQRFLGVQQYGEGQNEVAGVITDVQAFGFRDMPDETFTPARPRFLFTATVYVHPTVPATAN